MAARTRVRSTRVGVVRAGRLSARVDSALIRPLSPDDSMDELTEMLHVAYAELARAGMRFVATHQSVEVTRRRCAQGECWVAEVEGALVGTITIVPPSAPARIPWYSRPDVARANQFGVLPDLRGHRIGTRLLETAERRAVEMGASELALDTAEGATALIDLYTRHGYRFIDFADWRPETNYRSVVMSKALRLKPVGE